MRGLRDGLDRNQSSEQIQVAAFLFGGPATDDFTARFTQDNLGTSVNGIPVGSRSFRFIGVGVWVTHTGAEPYTLSIGVDRSHDCGETWDPIEAFAWDDLTSTECLYSRSADGVKLLPGELWRPRGVFIGSSPTTFRVRTTYNIEVLT